MGRSGRFVPCSCGLVVVEVAPSLGYHVTVALGSPPADVVRSLCRTRGFRTLWIFLVIAIRRRRGCTSHFSFMSPFDETLRCALSLVACARESEARSSGHHVHSAHLGVCLLSSGGLLLAHEGICEKVRRPGIRRRPALARAGVWSRDAKGVLAQGIELLDRPDGETHGTHAQWPLYVDLHLPLATTQKRARTWHPRSVVSGSGWAVPTVRLAAVSPSAQEGDHTPHARHPPESARARTATMTRAWLVAL